MKNTFTIILFLFVIVLCSCEHKVIKGPCRYDNLCDSNLYFSFSINGNNNDLKQKIDFGLFVNRLIDTVRFTQIGFVIGNRIEFHDENSSRNSEMLLVKEYNLSEVECESFSTTIFSDSIQYSLRNLTNEKFEDIYEDTLRSAYHYLYVDTIYNDGYSFPFDIKRFWFLFGGIDLTINYKGVRYCTSGIDHYNEYSSYEENRGSGRSYLVVTSMEHYYEDIYLIEGVFDLTLFEKSGERTIRMENGSFKLAVENSKLGYSSNFY